MWDDVERLEKRDTLNIERRQKRVKMTKQQGGRSRKGEQIAREARKEGGGARRGTETRNRPKREQLA